MENSAFVDQFKNPKNSGNLVEDLHPLIKLNAMISLSIANFLFNNIVFSLVMILLTYVAVIKAGTLKDFNKLYSKILICLGLFWFIFRAAFFEGETLIFEFAGIRVTQESIMVGITSSLAILAFSALFVGFFQIVSMNRLMLACENLGMGRTASFIILATFQSVIDLSDSSQTIMESQKARGIETDCSVMVRAKAYIPTLGPLVLNAISGTEEKTIAMEARAFSSPAKAVNLNVLPKVTAIQILLAVVVNVVLAISIAMFVL